MNIINCITLKITIGLVLSNLLSYERIIGSSDSNSIHNSNKVINTGLRAHVKARWFMLVQAQRIPDTGPRSTLSAPPYPEHHWLETPCGSSLIVSVSVVSQLYI